MTVFSSNTSARYRRSSVSVNPSCPSRVSVYLCSRHQGELSYWHSLPRENQCIIFICSRPCLFLRFPCVARDQTTGGRWDWDLQHRTNSITTQLVVLFFSFIYLFFLNWHGLHIIFINNYIFFILQMENMELTLRGSLQRLR